MTTPGTESAYRRIFFQRACFTPSRPRPARVSPSPLIMDSSASDPPHRDMATTLVLPPNNPLQQPQQPNGPGANRRYRPAPAKTFQCRGYGDCRMVFSRSEHLARHIRSVVPCPSSVPLSVPGSPPIHPPESTPANVLSLVIAESSSLVSTISANMHRPFTLTSKTPTSA